MLEIVHDSFNKNYKFFNKKIEKMTATKETKYICGIDLGTRTTPSGYLLQI
jgi:hypothetical protein